jgi:hypothetical protein
MENESEDSLKMNQKDAGTRNIVLAGLLEDSD